MKVPKGTPISWSWEDLAAEVAAAVAAAIAAHAGVAAAHHAKTVDASELTAGILALGRLSGITNVQIAAANKDGVAAIPSLRTLGSGAQQAAPGNHAHTLAVTLAFYDGNTRTTGTTSWVQMASASIPANAKKVLAWCFGSSDTSLKLGYCRVLYNGVQKLYSSNAYFAIVPLMWAGDGLGFAANLTIEIKKNAEAEQIVWGYGAWYVTT